MKKAFLLSLVSLMAVTTVSLAVDTFPKGLGKELMDPAKLKAVIDSGDPKYVVVDIRTESEYERGHIPSAICIPYGRASDVKNPPDKKNYIIVYCNTGVRSQHAAEQMLDDGYRYVLDWGGIWKDMLSTEMRWPYKLETSEQQPVAPPPRPSGDEGC